MAESRFQLRMNTWVEIGTSPLSYEIERGQFGYAPVALAVADTIPDIATANFRTLPQGNASSGGVDYASGKKVWARAMSSFPTVLVVSKE